MNDVRILQNEIDRLERTLARQEASVAKTRASLVLFQRQLQDELRGGTKDASGKSKP